MTAVAGNESYSTIADEHLVWSYGPDDQTIRPGSGVIALSNYLIYKENTTINHDQIQ